MTLNSVVLPAPLGPITPTTSPGATRQRDVVERRQAAEAHGDAVDLEAHVMPAPSGTAISRLRILPVGPLGSSSRNQTTRGYL